MKRSTVPPLLLRVCAELGAGRISEGPISDTTGAICDGVCHNGHITIDPSYEQCDSIIHECLHRLEPAWSENYVRNRTKWLMNRLSAEQIQTIYQEYAKRRKIRRTPRVI